MLSRILDQLRVTLNVFRSCHLVPFCVFSFCSSDRQGCRSRPSEMVSVDLIAIWELAAELCLAFRVTLNVFRRTAEKFIEMDDAERMIYTAGLMDGFFAAA